MSLWTLHTAGMQTRAWRTFSCLNCNATATITRMRVVVIRFFAASRNRRSCPLAMQVRLVVCFDLIHWGCLQACLWWRSFLQFGLLSWIPECKYVHTCDTSKTLRSGFPSTKVFRSEDARRRWSASQSVCRAFRLLVIRILHDTSIVRLWLECLRNLMMKYNRIVNLVWKNHWIVLALLSVFEFERGRFGDGGIRISRQILQNRIQTSDDKDMAHDIHHKTQNIQTVWSLHGVSQTVFTARLCECTKQQWQLFITRCSSGFQLRLPSEQQSTPACRSANYRSLFARVPSRWRGPKPSQFERFRWKFATTWLMTIVYGRFVLPLQGWIDQRQHRALWASCWRARIRPEQQHQTQTHATEHEADLAFSRPQIAETREVGQKTHKTNPATCTR